MLNLKITLQQLNAHLNLQYTTEHWVWQLLIDYVPQKSEEQVVLWKGLKTQKFVKLRNVTLKMFQRNTLDTNFVKLT